MSEPIPWAAAWQAAQTGPRGFYAREWPDDHFETSLVHPVPVAEEIAGILAEVDLALGSPPVIDLVDIGSGSGILLASIREVLKRRFPDLLPRLRARALDVRPRPAALDPAIEWWMGTVPESLDGLVVDDITGVVVAHEFLDDIPVEIVTSDENGGPPRLVLVDPRDGSEEVGPSLGDAAACTRLGVDASSVLAWLRRWWWPTRGRAEVGHLRDDAWREICSRMARGTAVAVDYAHERTARMRGDYAGGTLAAFRSGRTAPAIPDGSVNLTAQVALDSCAAAVVDSAAVPVKTRIRGQREVLDRAAAEAARVLSEPYRDVATRARALERVSRTAWLRDPAGPGGLTWLRQDLALPSTLPGWPPHRG